MTDNSRKILVFGTFDIIHPGHRWFLRQARLNGSELTAAIARDAFVSKWKGMAPLKNEEQRKEALLSSGLVDNAVFSDEQIHTYGVIERINPDVICLGHDQSHLHTDLISWLKTRPEYRPEIIIIPPWKREQYSSTLCNSRLREQA